MRGSITAGCAISQRRVKPLKVSRAVAFKLEATEIVRAYIVV